MLQIKNTKSFYFMLCTIPTFVFIMLHWKSYDLIILLISYMEVLDMMDLDKGIRQLQNAGAKITSQRIAIMKLP